MEYGNQLFWAASATNDAEDEHDGCEPDVDAEPSLGSFDRLTNQAHAWRQSWSCFPGRDYEVDVADREADEPLLTECADGLEAFR
jgi:hypothetical protein